MRVRHRHIRWVAPLAALLLIAGACGDDGDSDDAATDTTEETPELTTTTVQEATGEPIQVFVTSNTTGGTFSSPERFGAAEAAALAINERGGVNGRPIEVLTCDHEMDPNKQVECVREGADSEAVVMLAHFFVIGDQATPILDEAGMPEFGAIFTGYTQPRELSFNSPWASSPYAGLLMASEVGAASETLVANTNLPPLSDEALAAYEAAGIEYLGRVDVTQDTADFAPLAQATLEMNPDIVNITAMGPTEGANFVSAMDALGFEPLLSANSGVWTEETFEVMGESVDGRYFYPTSIVPLAAGDHPEITRFNEEMDAAQAAGISYTEEPRSNFALQAWVAVNAFAEVAASIDGDITRESVTEALQSAEDVDLAGIVPPWTPARDDDPDTQGRQVYNNFYIVTYEGGALKLYSDEAFCGTLGGC